MISREDAQKFFSQDKVWVWNDDTKIAVEGEPIRCHIDCLINKRFKIKSDGWYKNFSLEDPRPKRVFEDGALYPVRISAVLPNCTLRYDKSEDRLRFGNQLFDIEHLYFIGDKLPPELWGNNGSV